MAITDFTVAEVLAWARTKPADAAYLYTSPHNCALCHFLRDTGRAVRPVVCPQADGYGGWREAGGPGFHENPYPAELEPALKGGATFGGLVALLEALCPDAPVTKSDWEAIDTYLTDIEQVVSA